MTFHRYVVKLEDCVVSHRIRSKSLRPSNFYYNVSGIDAERLLLDKGMDGSFLARPSNSNPGDYTLSVRRNGRITHIKIQNTGDFLDLYGGETFATLTELVQYYMENPDQLREKDGDVIALRCPLSVAASEGVAPCLPRGVNERWFHGSLPGREAEEMLLASAKSGSFLVRESQSKPGQYVVSVRLGDKVTHVMIYRRDGKFDIGGGDTFDTLSDLLEHYRKNAMVEASGQVVHLKAPLPSTKVAAAVIKDRVDALQQPKQDGSGKAGFEEEFEALQQLECKHLYSRKEGQRVENRSKNRYKNILPFDHTRIALTDVKGPGADYINANLIEVLAEYAEFAGLQRRYISTQGCLPSTVDDFWRMIWQQDSRVIVMTTKEMERGRTKCTRYWPEVGETRSLAGQLRVKTLTEEPTADYTRRTMSLWRADSPLESERRLFHWQFVGWPDHGCPPDPGAVLNFLDQVNQCAETECPAQHGPLIVHCSAGIGRTGTFIVIDLILNQIKRFGLSCNIDIARSVQMIREQRSGMVQTEQQYKFLYLAVDYYIETMQKHVEFANRQPWREYTNIRYTTETASGQLTPTTPTQREPTADEATAVFVGGAAHRQPQPSAAMPFHLEPPPLPKRPPKLAAPHNDAV